MACQVRLELVPQLGRARRPIMDERDLTALQDKFRQDKCAKGLPRDREGGRDGWMGVHDRAHVRPSRQNP